MVIEPASRWERASAALVGWCGYVLLAAGTVLSLTLPGWTSSEALGTILLVGIALAWVYFVYTRTQAPRPAHRVRMLVFFAGLLVLASALMLRASLFFVFMIRGFFYASVLRPFALTIVGVGATSFLINTLLTGFPQEPAAWAFYGSIIAIQTFVIGFGTVIGEKLAEESAKRREAVSKLQSALEENAG